LWAATLDPLTVERFNSGKRLTSYGNVGKRRIQVFGILNSSEFLPEIAASRYWMAEGS